MTYAIIQPPFTLKFREMPKAELRSYYSWFMQVLPERIAALEEAVRASPTHGSWCADFSPASLAALGEWFGSQVEVRARTEGELDEVKSRLSFPVDVPGEELTNRSFSLAMDVGMYFSQVIIKNLPGTAWDQPLKNQKFADYGQPVLIGFGTVPLNPIRIVVTLAYAIAGQEQSGARLKALYDTWAMMRN
jgi:hypothetical protein